MDPQKIKAMRVSGTYLSVMISKDVWDHVLVPCLTYKYVYVWHDGWEMYSTWAENGEQMPLRYIRTLEHWSEMRKYQ